MLSKTVLLNVLKVVVVFMIGSFLIPTLLSAKDTLAVVVGFSLAGVVLMYVASVVYKLKGEVAK